jgi:peptidoglycan hydrolase-like protein with peptidoglycan-binding domain
MADEADVRQVTYEDAIRTWDAGKHPRAPAGAAGGGEFAPGSSGSGAKSGSAKSGSKARGSVKGGKAKGGKDTRATPTNQHPVGMGETGKRVSDLQARLNALGAEPPLKPDGIFGPKTLAAVRAFQKAHGLKVDGLVGPLTTAALRARVPAAPGTHAKHGKHVTPAAPAPPARRSWTTQWADAWITR